MERARQLLKKDLMGSPAYIAVQLTKIEALYLEISDDLAEAREALTRSKAQYCKPKMGTADWVFLADTVADLQREVDEFEGLRQAIQNRLDLGRALLDIGTETQVEVKP